MKPKFRRLMTSEKNILRKINLIFDIVTPKKNTFRKAN